MVEQYIVTGLAFADVNTDLLQEELNSAGYNASISWSVSSQHWLVNIFDGTSTQQIQTVVDNHDKNAQTTAQVINTSQQGLLDKAALALQFSANIKDLFNQVWDETENNTTQNTRFETLATLVDGLPNALKNRFYNDLLQEVRIDFLGLGADLEARLLAATATQRSNYCLYLRIWSQGLAFLLIINKVI